MSDEKFPALNPAALDATRRAIHAYARVAGTWAKSTRKKRKHWWHASLRPSLYGLTTGVIYGAKDFEIELDLDPLRQDPKGLSAQRWVLGKIRYGEGEVGQLVYIKSSVTGGEYEDVCA